MHQKTIAIDLDGTIYDYSEGWHGEDYFGDILPYAVEVISLLKANGWYIIIHTCRGNKEKVAAQLEKDGVPFDAINDQREDYKDSGLSTKPVADIYLDDRGLAFRGNWKRTLHDIINFKPWHEGDVPKNEDS